MKKLYYLFSLLLTLLILSSESTAQFQAFKLGIVNLQYRDTLGGTNNVLHFDIVLQHINEEVSGPFEYIGGQYFMNFNSEISNGGVLNYRRIGSDLPDNFRPVNPSITGNILRMASNFPSTPGPIITTSYPGTLISRMRLTTTASSFANVPLNLSWRTPYNPQPHTLIFAVTGGIFGVDVTNSGYFYVDSLNNMNIVNLITPAYNSTEYLSAVNFKWNKVRNASSYTLQIAIDSTMNTIIHTEQTGQDTSGSVSELLLSNRYYWRLKINDSSGADYYSYISRFYTNQILLSPPDHSINQSQSVNFVWKKVSDSVSKYIIEVTEDSTFQSISFSDTVSTDTSKLIRGLKFNSRYFWRVKVLYPGGGNDISSARSLKTLNESVHQTWPAYNYDFFTTGIEFKWDTPSIINYSKYYLKIAKDSLLNNVFYYDSVENANSQFVYKLDYNQRYYWTVAVKDSFNNFITSDVWTFRIVDLVMTLYSPGNNFNERALFMDLVWRKPVINAQRYKLIFSRDLMQEDVIFIDSALTETIKSIGPLDFETRYFWSVTAYDTIGNEKKSDVWNFRTITFLYSPFHNTEISSFDSKFVWYKLPTAVSYRLQVAGDIGFNDMIIDQEDIQDSIKFSTLPYRFEYYWRVVAKNSGGYFRTSETWKIRRDFPVPVEISSFNSYITKNNISLNWTTAIENNNSGFEIERVFLSKGNNPSFNNWSKVGYVAGNGTTTLSKNYEFTDRSVSSGNYRYRLKQIDFNGNYEYFELNNEVKVGVPDKYELSQNYPNPFNPTTNLEFGISDLGFVSLKIYDLSGKEVASLVNEVKPAGYYSVKFDGSNLPSGIYFYTFKAGDYNATKKMTLIK
jgi:hypothetical protein